MIAFDQFLKRRFFAASNAFHQGRFCRVVFRMTFVAVVEEGVRAQQLEVFLQKVAKKYVDEVDDWRSPDRGGVAEVVIDVIPPWEEDVD